MRVVRRPTSAVLRIFGNEIYKIGPLFVSILGAPPVCSIIGTLNAAAIGDKAFGQMAMRTWISGKIPFEPFRAGIKIGYDFLSHGRRLIRSVWSEPPKAVERLRGFVISGFYLI